MKTFDSHNILVMWFNQSPQLTWEDVVDTLFCYGLVNTAVPLANRHGVDWKPHHDEIVCVCYSESPFESS